jgi:hypothetical protein
MRIIDRRHVLLLARVCIPVIISIGAATSAASAGVTSKSFPVAQSTPIIETALFPAAFGSDTVFCGGQLLSPGVQYSFNPLTGRLSLNGNVPCDSITVQVFLLPKWVASGLGNPVPPGRKPLRIETGVQAMPPSSPSSEQKITLSGNKSFQFAVGRTGDGQFSQGLNLDFDALLSPTLHLRGAVSDRPTAGSQYSAGEGGTTLISELDKYFFEISGTHVTAQGGDITVGNSRFLPSKRIKGVLGAYVSDNINLSADVGHPAGRFASLAFNGIDGRQGPYQIAVNGLPVSVVPGSEKVYLDGRLLDGGAGKYYQIEYPAGRITFAPGTLITARSRIEVDFEAAERDYQESIYDFASNIQIKSKAVRLSVGGRRETDDKSRMQFGSLTSSDIDIIKAAGDSAGRAVTSGAVAATGGDYHQVSDSSGQHYQYAGKGLGEYQVTFTFLGTGKGDYHYLGDGVYQFAGSGLGEFSPVVYLPLPGRTDLYFSSLEISPYRGGRILLDYGGSNQDNNLFSSRNDRDNMKSQFSASVSHADSLREAGIDYLFRQKDYSPSTRLEAADFARIWGIGGQPVSADETRLNARSKWKISDNRAELEYGLLHYKKLLQSYRTAFALHLWDSHFISPRGLYQMGSSRRLDTLSGNGLFEKQSAGFSFKALKPVRIDFDYDRELSKDRLTDSATADKYQEYKGTLFFRNTVLEFSDRTDYSGGITLVKGPRMDKLSLSSDETLGRLRLTISGTWLSQKRLNSDRDNLNQYLYQTALRYAAGGGWLTAQADYRQNRQGNFAGGYRYLQVNPGEGNYRFENGQYLYDPAGDYIRLREDLGTESSSSVGEKSHTITLYPGRLATLKSWKPVLSQMAFRLRTEVTEEIPGKDPHTLAWILPWTSHSGLEYARRARQEAYSVLLFPKVNFYFINFDYAENLEEQDLGAQLYHDRKAYKIELKEQAAPQILTQQIWQHYREKETGGGYPALFLKRNDLTIGLSTTQNMMQITAQVGYTVFSDIYSDGLGSGLLFLTETVLRRPHRGEIRGRIELRSLVAQRPFDQPEFVVTDGNRFGKSLVAVLTANYDLGQSLRLTANFSDRVYENHPAEFVGRGELLVKF